MSLDQLFKSKKHEQDAVLSADADASGDFHSRAEEENAAGDAPAKSRKSSKRPESNRKNAVDDAALPEKKRARRRLIGAVALVLAAVIGLPMVFDSEPKSSTTKIAIEIPSKDTPSANPDYLAPSLNSDSAAASTVEKAAEKTLDKAEEIVSVATPVKDKAAVIEKKAETAPLPALVPVAPATSATPTKAPAQLAPTSSTKSEVKSETKPDIKPAIKKNTISDAERALALLEGRAVPSKELADSPENLSQKDSARAAKSDKALASFAVQVAALNSPEKVRELQNKLKAANIASYTQKITTKTGEVSRIRVGPFPSKAEAEKTRLKLVKLGLNGSLVPN